MPKKPLTLTTMICAFLAMLLINMLALRVSSITLMLIAGAVSLALFLCKGNAGKAGGTK